MRNFAFNVTGIFLLTFILSFAAFAAPGPKHDEICGSFGLQLGECPVVSVAMRTEDGSFVAIDYWLVFSSVDLESKVRKIEEGSQVRATGRLVGGGRYRYMVVSAVEVK